MITKLSAVPVIISN